MFDKQSIERIIRSVLKSEREIHDKRLHGEQYRDHQAFGLVRGRIAANFTGSTGTFKLQNIVPLGQSSPYPGTEIIVVNVNRASGSANGTAYAVYHYAAIFPGTYTGTSGTAAGTSSGTGTGHGNWELFTAGGGGSFEGVFGCIFKEIPAASMTLSGSGTGMSLSLTHGYGTDAALLLEVDGTGWREQRDSGGAVLYAVVNFSKSILRASGTQPIILQGALYDLGMGTDTVGSGTEESVLTMTRVFVPGNWDLRSLPGLDANLAQIPFRLDGEMGFQLGGEACGTGTGTGT